MALLNLIFKNKTNASIGGITLDASISENHVIASKPTRNPVEDGAKVTDHVELEPVRLTIQGVISDTPLDFGILNQLAKGNFKQLGKNIVSGIGSNFGKSSRSIEQYQALESLMNSREPFEVVTGLKVYSNMIMSSLRVNRTASSGKSLQLTAELEEIRIVSSKISGEESFADKAKNIANKNKNLGAKLADPVDPNQNQKLFTGSSAIIKAVKVLK